MAKGKCSKCEKPLIRNGRYCHQCHAAYTRKWRKSNPLTEEQRRKDTTRSYASVYKRRGHIAEEPCMICRDKAEMHHEDYDKPLKVLWLCRDCHLTLHKVKKMAESYGRSAA